MVTKDKEGHYIMIKGPIQDENTILNIYTSNIREPQYSKCYKPQKGNQK